MSAAGAFVQKLSGERSPQRRLPVLRHIPCLLIAASLASCVEPGPRPPQAETTPASDSVPTVAAAKPASTGPAADGFVRVVNGRCPVQPEHTLRSGVVLRELAVEHRGAWIGMCCSDCVDFWRTLSDAQRDELLEAVRATNP